MDPSRIDLVVTDLDGTLWDGGERVHERTLAALHTLEGRRVPVLVATGRRLQSAVRTLARSGLALPTVVLDGALGRDVGPGRTFHRAPFASDDAHAALDAFAARGLSPCLYVDRHDAEVAVDDDVSTHPGHLQQIGAWLQRSDDLHGLIDREPILMFAVVGRGRDELAAVARDVADRGQATVTRDVVYGDATLTVRAPGISKWDGVLTWCADQGVDPTRVLAVGDGHNDLELLSAARVACVVADGCDEALALAHHVIEPACDGGWASILGLVCDEVA
jgi:hydroxymethylpyrimidine pyrophosphatase-like HAD family hydrolase